MLSRAERQSRVGRRLFCHRSPHISIISCFWWCRVPKKDIRSKYAWTFIFLSHAPRSVPCLIFSPFFTCFFFLSLIPRAVSFHFLSGLGTPSLESVFFSYQPFPPPSPCPPAPLLYAFLLFFFFTLLLSLSHPPLPSLVISLSYVCPSLCVCVPPLFVSNSFSREIRDAYLVPLSSTGAAALSYIVRRWPHHQNAHSLVLRSTYLDRCQKGPIQIISPALRFFGN